MIRNTFEYNEDGLTHPDNDEALARALQEEYTRELQQTMEPLDASPQGRRPPPTAPTMATALTAEMSQSRSQSRSRSQFRSRSQAGGNSLETSDARRSRNGARDASRSSQEASDAEYAVMVALQDQGEWGVQWGFGMPSSRDSRSLPVVAGRSVHDQEFALRLEQEAMDEAYAKRISEYQEQQLSASRAHQLSAVNRRCTIHRICSLLFGLAIISAVAGAILYYAINGEGSLPDFIPDPEAFRDVDPFTDTNPEDASRWRNGGNGLTLPVINALDGHWHPYFKIAIQEWDDGNPDALTLTTTIEDPDFNCEPILNALKVCNGMYGATNWRGINKIILDRGWITASSAKMNEYYFDKESDAQRQYTMCHEIGHGFGLPHTDEDFYNKDLGNCMDYTNNPKANMQPDKMNFDFLAELYGTVSGSTTETESSIPGDRKLMTTVQGLLSRRQKEAFDIVDDHFSGSFRTEELSALGWKLLHRSKTFESHEMDLGSGMVAQVHLLLP